MTLFTKQDCLLCQQLKNRFDLSAMQVSVEQLDRDNADSLAHLAWHGLVETARKTLPLLVKDDSSTVAEFPVIEEELSLRAAEFGSVPQATGTTRSCEGDSCAMN